MYDYCRGGTFPPALWSSVWCIVLGDVRPDRPNRRTMVLLYPYTLLLLDPFCGRRYIWPVCMLVHLGWGHLGGCKGDRTESMWGCWERKEAPDCWGLRFLFHHPCDQSLWGSPVYCLEVVAVVRMVMGLCHRYEWWAWGMRKVWRG